jgi:membrane-bound lytic murein transglycosylase D
MPLETQHYVPKLQAVKNIVANPELFGLRLPSLQNHPYFLSVRIDRDMDIEVAAKLANLPLHEFKALNPQMNKPVVLAAATPQILLPYDNANLFVRNIAKHRGSMASWTAWVVPKTIRPADAARQWGMSEVALREINQIPPKMLVKAGSTLLVSRTQQSPDKVARHIVENASMALKPEPPPLRRLVVQAKRKDTMNAIARRYRVTTTQLADWNELSATSSLKAGQSLVLFLPSVKNRRQMAAAKRANNKRQVAAAKPTVNTKSNLSPVKLATTKAGVSGASQKVNVASNGR